MKGEKRQPWMKWYPADWRSDEEVRNCSLAARGLWVEMLCIAHKAEPYGYVLINGRALTSSQLAVQAGCSARDAEKFCAELEAAGVFSRDGDGRIYSRRMVRDQEKAERDARNGRGGGNPNLKPPDKGGVNPPDKGGVKAQKPEARSHIPDSTEPDGSVAPRSRRREPEHPLPSDWGPKPQHFVTAAKLGITAEHVPRIADNMRDWAAMHDHRRRNWDAQFSSFLRKEPGYGAKAGQHGRFDHNIGDTARDAEIRRRRALAAEAMATSGSDGSIERALRPDAEDARGDYRGRA